VRLCHRLLVLASLTVLMGHDDGGCGCGHDDGIAYGPPTGAECPDDATLTYANFGSGFMSAFCVDCHDSRKTGADRNGAPAFHDFDTLQGIRSVAEHIDWMAGAGPDAVNELMPPADHPPLPTLAERQRLAEWLACGAP
jgi:hypothetical protein